MKRTLFAAALIALTASPAYTGAPLHTATLSFVGGNPASAVIYVAQLSTDGGATWADLATTPKVAQPPYDTALQTGTLPVGTDLFRVCAQNVTADATRSAYTNSVSLTFSPVAPNAPSNLSASISNQ